MKSIKNYTSQVAALMSINYIEDMLINSGATRIVKDYANGKPTSISFMIMDGAMPVPVKLPAKVDEVNKLLRKAYPKTAAKNLEAQAERTAWKLIHDWVEIQISMWKLKQVELVEIFLPYVYDFAKNETMMQKIRSNGFLQLPQSTQ